VLFVQNMHCSALIVDILVVNLQRYKFSKNLFCKKILTVSFALFQSITIYCCIYS
jgi:hypothetical protein